MSTTFRERLRALPTFPRGLPPFDPDAAPDSPRELFVAWFEEAVASGEGTPQAMTLSTADAAGRVHARTVILKDLTADGWWFASQGTSPKSQDLAENPNAALTFLWRETGRQVRVSGPVAPASAEASAADFLGRPEGSRAACLVGRQSEPLASRTEYSAAYAAALATVQAEPATVSPTWTAYVLAPTQVEFWQASDDSGQTRLLYRSTGDRWEKGLLWP